MAIIRQYLNPYQGAIEAWVRPNWNGNDNKIHKIFHVDAEDTSCVLHLRFDEGSGNIAYDSSVYGNNGTINGATWTDGVVGKGLRFDGVNDYMSVSNNEDLSPKEHSYTAFCWGNISTNNQGAFIRYNNSGSEDRWLIWTILGDSKFYINDGTNYISKTGAHISDGEDHFLGFILDKDTDTFKYFVDNNLSSVDVSSLGDVSPAGDLWIGKYSSVYFFNGIMRMIHSRII